MTPADVGAAPIAVSLRGPLHPARFVERPNRFVVHCRLDAPGAADLANGETGPVVRAHLADPGRLRELLVPGRRLWLRPAHGAGRSTDWSAALVQTPAGDGLVSVDTTLPNRLVGEALRRGPLAELPGWTLERAEVRVGRSRFDFLLTDGRRRMALEVKSVSLVGDDGRALFPDAVTARGARHVRELAELAGRPDWAAALLFIVQREDAVSVEAAAAIDPDFASALARARAAGVHVFARRCHVGLEDVSLGRSVTVGTPTCAVARRP